MHVHRACASAVIENSSDCSWRAAWAPRSDRGGKAGVLRLTQDQLYGILELDSI